MCVGNRFQSQMVRGQKENLYASFVAGSWRKRLDPLVRLSFSCTKSGLMSMMPCWILNNIDDLLCSVCAEETPNQCSESYWSHILVFVLYSSG